MVNDEPGYGGVTTNGTHKVADDEQSTPTSRAPRFQSGQSVDERLDALREAIRTWDWRTASVEAGPPSSGNTAQTVSGLTTPPSDTASEDAEPPRFGSLLMRGASDDRQAVLDPALYPVTGPRLPEDPAAGSQDFLVEPIPRPASGGEPAADSESPPAFTADPPMHEDPTGVTQTVVLEPTPTPTTLHPAFPGDEQEPSRDQGPSHDAVPSQEQVEAPTRRSESRRGPIGRLWSHRAIKVAVLCLAAVLAVILIIWGIRLAHKGSGSPSLPPPSTAAQHSTSQATQAPVAPIDSAQLAQYEQYASGLQKANMTATNGFIGAGSTPTVAQLTPVVAAYRTALNLYDFQLHFIQWPASMQNAIQVDHAQFTALDSFLQAFSLVNPTGTGTWLSNLRSRISTTEAADNQVRKDLGLPSSSSFP